VLLFAAGLVAGTAMWSQSNPGPALLVGACLTVLSVSGFALLTVGLSVAERSVRIDKTSPQVSFIPASSAVLAYPILALLSLLPALVAAAFESAGMHIPGAFARFSPYVVGFLGLIWIAQQLYSLRRPAGLTLTAFGLHGVRGDSEVEMTWSDLDRVTVSDALGAKLMLRSKAGDAVAVAPAWMGSDPHEVAAIIDYYLKHPEDRELLRDPLVAIARVEVDLASRTQTS